MSIAPVQSFPPAKTEQSDNARVRPNQSPAAQPVSVALPKQEKSIPKNVPLTFELPKDVVEVHEDPESKNQVITQYLDKAKNVVLQVPSSEELSVERGIAQEFQQAAKLLANGTETAGKEEGKNHGD